MAYCYLCEWNNCFVEIFMWSLDMSNIDSHKIRVVFINTLSMSGHSKCGVMLIL